MAARPEYREIEHTADVGMELEAPDLRSAFELAAASMFDLICDLDTVGDVWRKRIAIQGHKGDVEHLMVRWLSELLYVFDTEGVLLSSFRIGRLEGAAIEAEVLGEPLDTAKHTPKVELKAATYHGLAVEESGKGWRVRVIFDT